MGGVTTQARLAHLSPSLCCGPGDGTPPLLPQEGGLRDHTPSVAPLGVGWVPVLGAKVSEDRSHQSVLSQFVTQRPQPPLALL